MLRHLSRYPLLAAIFILPAVGSENVTSIGTSLTTGTPTTSDGYTFENGVQSATSFSTATANYIVASLANNVFVRRNGTSANNSSVWYASSGNGTNLAGVDQTLYDRMLLSNNFYLGSDNTFSNDPGATGGNIERIDFTWTTARTASATLRFGVLDRGVVGAHDAFSIAAITAVDAAGNPTAYGSVFSVAQGWGGTANALADQNYRLFRYAAGNDISTTNDSASVNTQGIGGILISTSDLGLTNGGAFYGYSLFASDVTNPLDPGTFSTTTGGGNNSPGGLDLAAVNGLEIQAVPEPTSVALALLAGLPILLRSRRKNKPSVS